jgi:hypothetical protein
MSNLFLHCGTNVATREEVNDVTTPEPTETWQPIAHRMLIDTVVKQMTDIGLAVKTAEYGLWAEGMRMFAAFELMEGSGDYSIVVGLRNAHDMTFSAGMALGSRVFVCDNLAFSGEITIARKHTRWIERDLPRLTMQACGQIAGMRVRQDERIAAYKEKRITDQRAHDLVIRAVDSKVIPNARIPNILGEWRKPQHKDFEPRNVWSLFNSFTEVMKESNQIELPRRTVRLHGLMDGYTGLIAKGGGPVVGEGVEDADVRGALVAR